MCGVCFLPLYVSFAFAGVFLDCTGAALQVGCCRMPPPRKSSEFPKRPIHGDWRVEVSGKDVPEKVPPLRRIWQGCRSRAVHRMQVAAAAGTYEDVQGEEGFFEPMRPLTKWLRRLIGLFVLLPVAVVGLMALVQQLSAREIDVSFFSSVAVWYSLMGILLWCVIGFSHVCDLACIYLYVLGHELTHAAAVLCSFGKVESFSVTVEGGYVETTKNNLFIALSPYFIPLWALLWMGLMSLLHMFWTFAGYEELFYLGAGFLWGFHLYWTAWIIPREQPDLDENGTFFSFMLVYVVNLLTIVLILRCFGLVSLSGLGADFMDRLHAVGAMLADVAGWLRSRF